MQNKTRLLAFVLGFAVLVGGAGLLYNRLASGADLDHLGTGQKATTPEQGEQSGQSKEEVPKVPDFTVVDGDGNHVSLSDFIGKPIVLNFWASWCGPCKSEMPDFEQAYQEYGEEIHFLMINCTDGSRETVDSARGYIEKQGYTFPVYYDTQLDASMNYGASSLPMTFFIDREGYGVTYAIGALSRELLEKGIGMVLAAE